MPPINVNLSTNANTINASLAPLSEVVPNNPSQQVTLTWKANGGASFPANAVSWKATAPGTPQPPTVQNAPGATTIVSAPYTNDFQSRVTWSYAISVEQNGVLITIDPEVVNDPPDPPM